MNRETKKLMFSKKSDEWTTPDEFYDKLDKEFHFTLDPCATDGNHKCDKYFTIDDDGLKQSWENETVFINPPYSQTKLWLAKAHMEARDNGAKCVVLIPSRTDCRYFSDFCMKANRIRFVKGRLKFGDNKNAAPFPSMVVIFDFPTLGNVPMISTIERK